MGGTTFEHYAPGVDVNDAFKRAHEEASYEHGHGGYTGTIAEKGSFTIITRTPLLEREAEALAQRLINDDDVRISDKWGPAGAIPVVKATRLVNVKDFEYVHDTDFYQPGQVQPELLAAVQPLVKLKKGETIQSVAVTGYNTPSTRGTLGPRSSKTVRSMCSAVVTVNKPPTTRKAPLVLEIPAGLDWQQTNKEIAARVQAMRLKPGEKVIDWHVGESTQGKARVTARAPKGKTVTKFVVLGTRAHSTWETGFDTQAEARAWATEVMKDPKYHWEDITKYEIEGITRREDGSPLVEVVREVGKRMVDVEVEVKLAGVDTGAQADGWLFFGWASC